MMRFFGFTVAGHTFTISFEYPETVAYFARFLTRSEAREATIHSSPLLVERGRLALPPGSSDGYVESRTLIDITAKALLAYNACIFHAVSFIWQDRAWLLTAPSGVGKTTQFRNWQRLFPGEITMICGDMPVLERREDGSVWAHPSPWNGKEDLGDRRLCAPVAGIVLLEQGKDNMITPLTARYALMPFFEQFVVRPETEEQICALANLMDQMLRNVPCFKFVNVGDDASTALLRETLAPLAEGGSL